MPVLKQLVCAEHEKEANQYLLEIQRAGYWVQEIKLWAYGIGIIYIIESPPPDFDLEWLTTISGEDVSFRNRMKGQGMKNA